MNQVTVPVRIPSPSGPRVVPDSIWLSSKWPPISVGVVFLVASLLLSQKLITHELADTARQVKLEADAVAQEITACVDLLASVLDDVANLWHEVAAPTRTQWEEEAALHLRHCPYCSAMVWIDPALQAQWIAPANPQVRRRDLGVDPQLRQKLAESLSQRSAVVWRSSALLNTGAAVEVYVPIFVDERFHGYVLGIYPVRPLFDMLLKNIALRYSVAILAGDQTIYRRSPVRSRSASGHRSRWRKARCVTGPYTTTCPPCTSPWTGGEP
jgi:sensor domain CHASE-containing protein